MGGRDLVKTQYMLQTKHFSSMYCTVQKVCQSFINKYTPNCANFKSDNAEKKNIYIEMQWKNENQEFHLHEGWAPVGNKIEQS